MQIKQQIEQASLDLLLPCELTIVW